MLIKFIILQVLHVCLCYDIELEGVMRMQQDFLDQLNGEQSVNFFASKDPIAQQNAKTEIEIIPKNNNLQSDKTPPEANPFKFVNILSEIIPSRKSSNLDAFVHNYMKNLIEKGVRSLKLLDKSVKEQLNLNMNESKIIEPIIRYYISEMRNNFEMIEKQKAEFEHDQTLVLLDMIETSNKILYSGKKKLINEIMIKNNADITKVQKIIVKVFKESVYDKRDELKYICDEVKVCHTYPGFSDYIADLISEVLNLDNRKFGLAMKHLRKLVKSKINFLRTVIADEVIVSIGDKMQSTAEKDIEMRDLLSMVRAVIVQRYKLVQSKDEGIKLRTSAIRILIDIIDKAFGMEDESIMNMHFDSTVKGLRHYVAGYRRDVDSILNTFVNHIVGILKHNLNKTTKDEVKALTEIIILGETKDMDRFRYLFETTRGSKFIRVE